MSTRFRAVPLQTKHNWIHILLITCINPNLPPWLSGRQSRAPAPKQGQREDRVSMCSFKASCLLHPSTLVTKLQRVHMWNDRGRADATKKQWCTRLSVVGYYSQTGAPVTVHNLSKPLRYGTFPPAGMFDPQPVPAPYRNTQVSYVQFN